jgi:branched-chain amino acid transport system permease protein
MLPGWTRRVAVALFLAALLTIPLQLIPGLKWLGENSWLTLLGKVLIMAIAALGLHVLLGLAGQVSLGHAFFMGVGAYTAAVVGGEGTDKLWGLGLPIWVWLPAAGIVAALIGILVAPTAVRVRGLYLAIVTLGLVFIGEYLFANLGFITGGSERGRRWPSLEFKFWKEEVPFIDFASDGAWFGVEFSRQAKSFYLLLAFVIVFAILAKNIQRTRIGRAFMSIRDRDVAAEVMGVAEAHHKTIAFALSSFYAGVGGALLASFFGLLIPENWDLFLSVEIVAIILIGGIGTIAGTMLGTVFLVMLPELVKTLMFFLEGEVKNEGPWKWLGDVIITQGDDFGFISSAAAGPGLSIFQFNTFLFGLLIVLFLIFEPLGLYGVWIKIRNYWKAWPFTY